MVWSCFDGNNTGGIFKIDRIIIKVVHLDILKNHAIPSGTQLIGEPFIFQEENDPKYSSTVYKNHLSV